MSTTTITGLTAGTVKSTDVYPAVDTTDSTQAPSGTTKKYTISGLTTYLDGNLGTITNATWNGTVIGMTYGGTGANLTPSNGGIFYSTGTTGAILSGTATANQMLQSGASGAPTWSTATFASTYGASQILYSNGANTVTGLATANNSVLTTNGSGVPSLASSLPSGTTFINFVDQTSSSVTMATNTGYVTDNGASLVTYALPTTAAQGKMFWVVGNSSGGFTVSQNAGQNIVVGTATTTTGTGGSLTNEDAGACALLVCIVANTTFQVFAGAGNFILA